MLSPKFSPLPFDADGDEKDGDWIKDEDEKDGDETCDDDPSEGNASSLLVSASKPEFLRREREKDI